MKYFNHIMIFLFALLPFTSCDDNAVSFGSVEYYPAFLWVDANITPVTKTFEFDFSLDAQNDSKSFAEFQFVDNNGNSISTDVMQVRDGDQTLKDNRFRVPSNIKSKELTFTFSPNALNGKHQGYLKLISHNLDRIESEQLKPGDKPGVFQWTLHYDKTMNPLAKTLLCILIMIIACLLLWFILLRPSLYPHFGKFTKSILIKQNDTIIGQLNYAFKGARKVVFYDKKIKQSYWNRIFVGEIKTYVNPIFKTKLTFSPKKKNAAAFGIGYTVNPNPIPRSGVATINNYAEKLSIILR